MTARRVELARIVRLSLPLMGAQGGIMLMGTVDALVVGRISSVEMAAVALGNSIVSLFIVLGIGLVMGIEPLVAQAIGAGEPERARGFLWQGIYVGAIASVPIMLATAAAGQGLERIGIAADISARADAYLWSRLPSIFFGCLYSALRAYLGAAGRGRPTLVAVGLANVVNLFLDVALGLGMFGFPRWGAVGTGICTSVCYALMAGVAALAVRLEAKSSPQVERRLRAPRPGDMARVVRLGWPVGLQLSTEVGIFALVTALVGRLGAVPLAGHQIAITLASLTFMCAVGVANAATARVGYHVGAMDHRAARQTGLLGMCLGGGFMGSMGVLFLLFAEPLAWLFAPQDPPAIAAGAALIRIAAVFSVSDGVQCVTGGALRGAGDTRWTFYAHFAGNWLVGLPVAWLMGQVLGLGAAGYWWGLTVGLTGVATILVLRFLGISSRPITRA